MHQLATLGAFLLLIGQIIWVWNMVSSWVDGPIVETGDPWNLKDTDMHSREWTWFEQSLNTTIAADGGEEEESLTDGGERSEGPRATSEPRSDDGEERSEDDGE
jgi:cytochrome c oxidase subunit 1